MGPRRRPIVLACLAAFAATLVLAAIASAGNPANRLADKPIDPYQYDYAHRCGKHPQKGTLALQSWLEQHARGVSWGIMRCEKLSSSSYSLHSEGRALDWHLDVHDTADRHEAKRLINLFLAYDKAGNNHALARRMGIQELIWNCRAWWAGDGGMHEYSACANNKHVDDTTAHRNHIHIGLNWRGAKKRSTFWRYPAG
jgi:hypothetical protein